MAHPNREEVKDSINAKMRRMTKNYGEADPNANFKAPSEKYKLEGPEPHVGFGADSVAVNARSDKPARRAVAANPIATYKKGGKVKHRDGGGDVSDIETANLNQSLGRARGGRLNKHHKGSTHVNVMIAPQGAGAGATPPLPPQLAGALPKPPMAPPPGPPLPPPGAGGPPGLPPGGPPGAPPMMRKRGGKVHADEAQDKALIKKELKNEGLVRKARGGALHMTGGSVSGPGREEKNEHYKKYGDKSKQEV